MNRSQMLKQLDDERRHSAGDGQMIDVLPRVSRLRGADGSWHCTIYSSVDADSADMAIAQEIEHHRRLGASFEWKLFAHDRPPDMLERLRRHGFDIGPAEAVMAYDLGDGASWMHQAKPDVQVCRVTSARELDDYRRVVASVFGPSHETHGEELAAALRSGSEHYRGYVAYAAGQPVGVGRLDIHRGSAF